LKSICSAARQARFLFRRRDGRVFLRRQLRPAFCTAALQYKAPGFGGHPGTKTVGACALDFAGLECAFHDYYLDH
jgi:hypothetical protein